MQIVLCYVEVRPIKEDDLIRPERDNARMVRWMYNVRPEYRISGAELRTRLKLKSMRECLQDSKLLERMEESVWSSKCSIFRVSCDFPKGRPRKTQKEVIRSNLKK